MSDVYSVEFSARFYVMADSNSEAVEIAERMSKEAESYFPAQAVFRVTAYRTPNQDDRLKRFTENHREVSK